MSSLWLLSKNVQGADRSEIRTWDLPYNIANIANVATTEYIFLPEMKQGYCICPPSWSVHCNFTGDAKCSEKGWACTPHPHQPGLILLSWWNVWVYARKRLLQLCVLCGRNYSNPYECKQASLRPLFFLSIYCHALSTILKSSKFYQTEKCAKLVAISSAQISLIWNPSFGTKLVSMSSSKHFHCSVKHGSLFGKSSLNSSLFILSADFPLAPVLLEGVVVATKRCPILLVVTFHPWCCTPS